MQRGGAEAVWARSVSRPVCFSAGRGGLGTVIEGSGSTNSGVTGAAPSSSSFLRAREACMPSSRAPMPAIALQLRAQVPLRYLLAARPLIRPSRSPLLPLAAAASHHAAQSQAYHDATHRETGGGLCERARLCGARHACSGPMAGRETWGHRPPGDERAGTPWGRCHHFPPLPPSPSPPDAPPPRRT